jgi:hypothetical protein
MGVSTAHIDVKPTTSLNNIVQLSNVLKNNKKSMRERMSN